MAIGVEEINGFEDGVIGYADDIDATGLQTGLGRLEFVQAVYLESNVLHPVRRIDVTPHLWRSGQLKECQYISVSSI